MDAETRAEVLAQISNIQHDGGAISGTSPVTVQIGGTDSQTDIVEHESLYLKNAPPKIVNQLTRMGFNLSVTDDGVRVE